MLGWKWRDEGGERAYKTQTVGGLEGLLGTGVPLLESWRTWWGIEEDMLALEASCAGVIGDALRIDALIGLVVGCW